MSSALVLIDFINEIVDPKGKFAGMGFPAYMEKHGTFDNLRALTSAARKGNVPVVHVRLGYSKGHKECPEVSPLFSMAKKYGAVELGDWSTEFHGRIDVRPEDPVLVKPRVSAFYCTGLEALLRAKGIDSIYIAGVATNVAVMGAVMDAHDMDYKVTVVEDCCAASDDGAHAAALQTMGMIAQIKRHSELKF